METKNKKNQLNKKLIPKRKKSEIPKRERKETLTDFNTCGWLILTHLKKMIKKPKEDAAYTYDDLYRMPDKFMYKDYYNFEKYYTKELKKKGNKFNMFSTILGYLRTQFFKALIVGFIYYGIQILFALILKQFLSWLGEENPDEETGWILTGILCAAVFIKSIASLWFMYHRELCTVILKNCTRVNIFNFKNKIFYLIIYFNIGTYYK